MKQHCEDCAYFVQETHACQFTGRPINPAFYTKMACNSYQMKPAEKPRRARPASQGTSEPPVPKTTVQGQISVFDILCP